MQFQSTPPRRRRPALTINSIERNTISIHASAKEATKDTLARYFEDEISIHASAKEATENHFASEDSGNISIHASAKEATGMASRSKRWRNISIHASAKEATVTIRHRHTGKWNFNPRLREGGDRLGVTR